ncbi:MAG: ferrous iron transport protein B, partial [Candidatus Syntrophosphaera sp.]|nr:ferrous iron transport protein B [Candidatus Syntrophosphaera sp.]
NNPVIALAGNPNVGKTTLFNALTGSHQTVGNWPGVTVEHKQGYYLHKGKRYDVIDLPGIYSLTANSPDELVTRNYLLQKKPDLVINIVDASNLERNLYLSVQLMEMRVPLLLVFSMVDIADQNGIQIDYEHLRGHLDCPVQPLVLSKRFDPQMLFHQIEYCLRDTHKPAQISYDEVVARHLGNIEEILVLLKDSPEFPTELRSAPQSWLALKLLERDPYFALKLPAELIEAVDKEVRAVEKHRNQSSAAALADDRYGFIRGLVKDVVKRKSKPSGTFSDRIDRVVLNGFWGLPIFFGVMYLVFLLAVRASAPLIGWIGDGLNWLLVEQWGGILRQTGLPEWLAYLLADAVGGGLATIATFIPPIFFIFMSLAILEDSGYIARAAFIADKFMRRIGLPGKAFIPLLVGFGCTVPAIMATRTLESKRDRIFVSLLTPFMSCGAKLPVYTYLVMIFFTKRADIVIFGLYLFGVAMAMLFGLMLKKTLFKTDPGNFVMELPPYHLPTVNAIGMHTWHRLKDFILRAGKTILIVTVAVTILQGINVPGTVGAEGRGSSILELGGKAITPVLAPLGIERDNWPASVALISGLFAKEAIVGTMQGLYNDPENILQAFGGQASALSFLIFVLLYSPCAASLTMLFKEHGWGWMLFAFGYLTLLAWIVATVAYQILAFNARSWLWLAICAALAVVFWGSLKIIGRTNAVTSQ